MINSDIYLSVKKRKTEKLSTILKKTIFAYFIGILSFSMTGITVYILMKNDPLLFSLVPKEELYSTEECKFNEYDKCTVHREKLSAMGLAIFYHFLPRLISFLFIVGISGTILTVTIYKYVKKYFWETIFGES